MATSTFNSRMRSRGGGPAVVTPAVLQHVLPFYFDATLVNTTPLTLASGSPVELILPPGAIVTMIQVDATASGGTSPTFDMGWAKLDGTMPGLAQAGLISEGDAAGGGMTFTQGVAGAGAWLSIVLDANEPVRLIGGVGASAADYGGAVGFVHFHVNDSGT